MPSFTAQTPEKIQPVPLSPLEDLFWRAGKPQDAFRVGVMVRLDGWVEAATLEAALRGLQRRHPKLRARISEGVDGRRRYEFDAPPPPIPFHITDHQGEESPWREEMRRLFQKPFAATGPVVEIGVLRNRHRSGSELLVTAHHAIADGLSAIILVHDLLTEYANAESGAPDSVRPMAIVTEARTTASSGWRARLWLLRRYLRIQREERRARQTRLPETTGVPPQSQWVHWVFSREDTVRLVRRCRKQQASLDGVLVAATCSGLMDCLPVPTGVFKCQLPFNLRDSLEGPLGPITPHDLGNFVSVMNALYEVHPRPVFWDLARMVSRDMEGFARNGGPSFFYNLAGLTANRLFERAAPVLMTSKDIRVTLLATNYGVLNMRDAYGSLHPRECTLVFKHDGVGPSLVMETLVLQQRLNIGFAADGLEPAFWERLQASVHKHLIAAAT
jgi:hypothetical protein